MFGRRVITAPSLLSTSCWTLRFLVHGRPGLSVSTEMERTRSASHFFGKKYFGIMSLLANMTS